MFVNKKKKKMEIRLNLILTYSASFFDVRIPSLVRVKMGGLEVRNSN